MRISLVVATDLDGVIGLDQGLPWHLPADLKRFRKLTLGKPVVLGRRTFEAIGKPLPGRTNIVLTSRPEPGLPTGVLVARTPAEALVLAGNVEEVMVGGGAVVYEHFLPRADRIHLTRVRARLHGDTRFPAFDPAAWVEVAREEHEPDERNRYAWSFLTLERRPVPFALPAAVLVREVPASYARCLRRDPVAIDVAAARAQHAGYVSALREAGAEVVVLPADEGFPDASFVEDCAVVAGGRALLTRPGAPSRQGEVGPVADALARWYGVQRMEAPATLDGGDVLRVGRRLFVGLSGRTNLAGLECLERLAALDGLETVRVVVRAGLHLKSACGLAAPGLVLLAPGVLDPAPFEAAGLECLAVPEPVGSNCLPLGDRILVSADCPGTLALLVARGLRACPVRVTEFHKGDGALTCLSIRVPSPGTWCT
ncbi:MAG: type 3 dihydrofolate reductase [Planctomycetes bacterium]|nr:type 3 dihydrofolate reductase [Planctomycetota bacterium]